ncbi:MAG: hypothetical protein ABI644_00930, partial [Arenimonas sp.]
MKKILSLGMLLVAMSGLQTPVAIAASVNPALEFTKLQRPSDAIGSLGNDLFGEKTDFYTGSTSFGVTDISVPGNSQLPVALSRSLSVSEYDAFTSVSRVLGNWEIDVPKMSGIFASGHGWTVASASPNSRCSSPAGDLLKARPPMVYVGATPFFPVEYWHGYSMEIPGAGSQELLLNHGANPQPTQGGPYHWTTKGNWRIACLPTITGGLGEGFLAVAPDGTKYFFNKMVITGSGENAVELSKPYEFVTAEVNSPKCPPEHGSFSANLSINSTVRYSWYPPTRFEGGGGPGEDPESTGRCIGTTYVTNITTYVSLSREKVEILATRVEDRFGNWLTYNYDAANKLSSISSNDGRSIALTYNGNGTLSTAVSAGKTWSYSYVSGIINGTSIPSPLLSQVVRPDASSWSYQYEGNLSFTAADTGSLLTCLRNLQNPPGSISFLLKSTHPSGAKGEFRFERIRHELTNVPYACDLASQGSVPLETATLWYPRQFATVGIKSKLIYGPGIPGSTWTYNYLPAVGGFLPTGFVNPNTPDCSMRACDTSKSIEVTSPDASITRYQFGIEYQKTEGQLQKVEIRRDNKIIRTEIYQYVSAYDDTQAYISLAGISPQPRANMLLSNSITPQKKKTILQDGVAFDSMVESFDVFASPVKVTSSSSLGYTRTDTNTYEHKLAKWVVGLPSTTVNNNTSKLISQNVYDDTTALPIQTYSFGLLANSLTYHPDGNVNSVADGAGNLTSISNYFRGTPRSVIFADNTSIG